MLILGLTGTSGSGKSTVSSIFANLGATIVDADKIYAELLLNHRPMIDEIANNFDVITDGKIDRKKLRDIVFIDKNKLILLNKITHKYVLQTISEQISQAKDIAILDVPLLFEAGLDTKCDKVLGVICSDENKINRICNRDGVSKEDAIKRLENQKNNCFFIENCDIIIENDCELDVLQSVCTKIYNELGEENAK